MRSKSGIVPRKKLTKPERQAEVERLVKNSPAFQVLSWICEELKEQKDKESYAMDNTYKTIEEFMKGRGRIQALDSIYAIIHGSLKKAKEAK